jgi:hypothetical protein
VDDVAASGFFSRFGEAGLTALLGLEFFVAPKRERDCASFTGFKQNFLLCVVFMVG